MFEPTHCANLCGISNSGEPGFPRVYCFKQQIYFCQFLIEVLSQICYIIHLLKDFFNVGSLLVQITTYSCLFILCGFMCYKLSIGESTQFIQVNLLRHSYMCACACVCSLFICNGYQYNTEAGHLLSQAFYIIQLHYFPIDISLIFYICAPYCT